jgi:hypothetical protein
LIGSVKAPTDISERMLSIVDITKETINKRLKNFKVPEFPGVDDSVPRILFESADYRSQPLEDVYKKFLQTVLVAHESKTTIVAPIHKKGSRDLPCNCRPVSLTSHMCIVFECIVRDSTVEYLC